MASNIHKEQYLVDFERRKNNLGYTPKTFWLTGLSGSGKSTIAKQAEHLVYELGMPIYVLDGDNLRFGLNKDLAFSTADRVQNLRRNAEVAKLMNLSGTIAICAFISPTMGSRAQAQSIIGQEFFREIYINASLATCEKRDRKGLYKKARAGEIKNFTGISQPYESPISPNLEIKTDEIDVMQSSLSLANYIVQEVKL